MSKSLRSGRRVCGWAVGFALVVELASCHREPHADASDPSGKQVNASPVAAGADATAPQQLPTAVLDRKSAPPATTTEGAVGKPGFGPASLALGLDLLREVSEPGRGNVVIAPLSIELAFAMPWLGARETTAAEMARVLHYWDTPLSVARDARQLTTALSNSSTGGNTLALANQLFLEATSSLLPDFARTMREQFSAPVERVDFVKAPEVARGEINAWVSRRTQAHIPELLPVRSVSDRTRLVLTNAAYFAGRWQLPFPVGETRMGDFLVAGKQAKPVPMMHREARFGFAQEDDVGVVELPYVGGTTSLVLFLPRDPEGLPAFEASLTAAAVASWFERLQPTRVALALPRLELRHAVRLKAPLTKLGMAQAFTDAADFGGISAGEDLYIDDGYHQTFLKLDESGTEAAAATAVVVNTKSASRDVPFVVNHPFLFAIRDVASGAILFMGRVEDPSG